MQDTQQAIYKNFVQTKFLYHMHSEWPGVDSDAFVRRYQALTGQPASHVKQSELRVEADSSSTAGQKLYYQATNGPKPVLVEQCSLELFQEELADMDPMLLRKLATCCSNDFRTILLLHDKRILGIVQEEVPSLIRRGVLTKVEAERLQHGIADTLLPGTPALAMLLEQSKEDESLKDEYIIKPVRDASYRGIKLGKNISQEEWLEILEEQSKRVLRPTEGANVVQKLAKHVWYDIIRHEVETEGPEKFHLIGSHHMINSQTDVFGPWRLGQDIHVGLTRGAKGVVMSTGLPPDESAV